MLDTSRAGVWQSNTARGIGGKPFGSNPGSGDSWLPVDAVSRDTTNFGIHTGSWRQAVPTARGARDEDMRSREEWCPGDDTPAE